MSYEATKVGNLILSHSSDLREPVSNLRLNKLLYLVHGWSLTHTEEGLIRNHFEAWKLGPVIRTVYDSCKKYGDGPIEVKFRHLNYATGKQAEVDFTDISSDDKSFIMRIVYFYDNRTTYQLVELTHEPDGPWDAIVNEEFSASTRIPNELIRAHFRAKIGDRRRS